jgi:hypothetical protein
MTSEKTGASWPTRLYQRRESEWNSSAIETAAESEEFLNAASEPRVVM